MVVTGVRRRLQESFGYERRASNPHLQSAFLTARCHKGSSSPSPPRLTPSFCFRASGTAVARRLLLVLGRRSQEVYLHYRRTSQVDETIGVHHVFGVLGFRKPVRLQIGLIMEGAVGRKANNFLLQTQRYLCSNSNNTHIFGALLCSSCSCRSLLLDPPVVVVLLRLEGFFAVASLLHACGHEGIPQVVHGPAPSKIRVAWKQRWSTLDSERRSVALCAYFCMGQVMSLSVCADHARVRSS